MKQIVSASPLSVQPHYCLKDGSGHAETIHELFVNRPDVTRALDREGIQNYFNKRPDGIRTCFENVRLLPENHGIWVHDQQFTIQPCPRPFPPDSTLSQLLEEAVARILSNCRRPVLALSGGLDSALLLALAAKMPDVEIAVCTMVTGWSGYCEEERTRETAMHLGVNELHVIRFDEEAFVSALPEAIAACETPLYNLHPVSKWLLAIELYKQGFDCILTGDGADQLFAGADPRNYIPIVGAMVRASGLKLSSPFLDHKVIAWARRHPVDQDKSLLRNVAAELIPSQVLNAPKRGRFAPDMPLDQYRSKAGDQIISAILGSEPPGTVPGPDNTLWATLTLLLQRMEVI